MDGIRRMEPGNKVPPGDAAAEESSSVPTRATSRGLGDVADRFEDAPPIINGWTNHNDSDPGMAVRKNPGKINPDTES